MSLLTVQTKLRAAGFDPGPLDGAWGRQTEAALDAALSLARTFRPVPAESNAANVLRVCIDPALKLLPARMDSVPARVIMLAITGQEADFHHRWQVFDRARPNAMGAARGLGQFERGGGAKGVLTHPSSKPHAIEACRKLGVPATVDAVYNALHANDVLAGVFIRLLLWTNPNALPAVGQEEAAFQLYLREWRPGAWTNGNPKQRDALRQKWRGYYATAVATVEGRK